MCSSLRSSAGNETVEIEQRYEPIREGEAEGGRGQPECFHGDWVSAMPLRGQRSLTRRSICHAASGGSQSRERDAKKRRPIRGEDGDSERTTGELRGDEVRWVITFPSVTNPK